MNSRKTVLSVAAAGTAAGVVGLVLLATPAGAGEAPPALPQISAQELVESVMNTKMPALSGSVALENNLGLPIPGVPTSVGDGDSIKVWADGQGKGRISIAERNSEQAVIDDGSTVWVWNSDERSVIKMPHPGGDKADKPLEGKLADPAAAATELVNAMQADSTVTVDGTARIADRPVYQLVLTPKPTERTLLREVRVSVDSELRIPLQLEVLANGQADPALKVGFTEFSDTAPDPSLFTFTPPAGAKVTERDPNEPVKGKDAEELLDQVNLQHVGRGWDLVVTGKVPADALSMAEDMGGEDGRRGDQNPLELLNTIGKEVTGDFGRGWVITTKVGTALLTEDGRFAIGAVPEQVVTEAIATVK